MTLGVRLATEADVEQMSALLIASISQLCAADHRNDPALIASWTRNKSPQGVRAILDNPDVVAFVAERDGVVVAVGCTMGPGEVGLNYVHPAHRFAGASKALLAEMERALRARGTAIATLTSTATAHCFYLAAGWEDAGPPVAGFAMVGHPMRKAL